MFIGFISPTLLFPKYNPTLPLSTMKHSVLVLLSSTLIICVAKLSTCADHRNGCKRNEEEQPVGGAGSRGVSMASVCQLVVFNGTIQDFSFCGAYPFELTSCLASNPCPIFLVV